MISAVQRWQYYCLKCGTTRDGLLDRPHGIGGYSWACPDCKSHDIGSYSMPPEPKL